MACAILGFIPTIAKLCMWPAFMVHVYIAMLVQQAVNKLTSNGVFDISQWILDRTMKWLLKGSYASFTILQASFPDNSGPKTMVK